MNRSAGLHLIRGVLVLAGAVVVAAVSFGVFVISVDIQSEDETLEEKS